jgi:hypothetical protein
MTADDHKWLLGEIEDDTNTAVEMGETPKSTADEWLDMLRQDLANAERADAATVFKGIPAHKREAWLARNRDRSMRLRRLLDDPELVPFLLDWEDRLIYGESVAETKRRHDIERN